jgi:hypothetical protein
MAMVIVAKEFLNGVDLVIRGTPCPPIIMPLNALQHAASDYQLTKSPAQTEEVTGVIFVVSSLASDQQHQKLTSH